MQSTLTLGKIVNSVNEIQLFGVAIPAETAIKISDFIAERQGLPNSYWGLFAPLDTEIKKPFTLFTGEQITSDASVRHILGEEALRILRVLGQDMPNVQRAIISAQAAFGRRLMEREGSLGTYCCGKCSVAYWRTLATNWMPDAEQRLRAGMEDLRHARQNGKWGKYLFYYTVHCLTELPRELAAQEISYIAPTCERGLHLLRQNDSHYKQKSAILLRLLDAA